MIQPVRGFELGKRPKAQGDSLCLPFDCLTPPLEARLRRLPYNAIHLEEPRPTLAAGRKLWEEWKKSGYLASANPAYYLLDERFGGGSKLGFLGMLDLKHAGRVWPHEKCYRRFIERRKKHLLKLKIQLSPVFLIAQDAEGALGKTLKELRDRISAANGGGPVASRDFGTGTFDGVKRRAWRLEDTDSIALIRAALKAQTGFLIADGHHRFNAALELFKAGRLSEVLVYVTSAKAGAGLLKAHPPVPGRKKAAPPPPPLEEIVAKARQGVLMPRKMTYFWPKVPCGIVYAETSKFFPLSLRKRAG